MKKDNTQEMIVYRIVKLFQPIRTEQVKIRAMYQGVRNSLLILISIEYSKEEIWQIL